MLKHALGRSAGVGLAQPVRERLDELPRDPGVVSTIGRNSQNVIAYVVMSVSAVTVAVRAPSSISAISPK